MDFADIGAEATEVSTDAAIHAVRALASKTLEATGRCRNPRCEDETDKVFCSPACRDEYDYIKTRMK